MPVIETATTLHSFTATGNGAETGIYGRGAAFVEGTFVGAVVLECRPPGAAAFMPVLADGYGTGVRLTAPGRVALDEPCDGTRYRWRCSEYSSGTILTALQQGG